MSRLKAWLVRTGWTTAASVLGAVPTAALFDIKAWKAAAMVGATTLFSAVLVAVRAQADRLPEVTS